MASSVFRDRFGCWGFLDLWRTGSRRPFTATETGYLAGIAGPVTAALRRSQAETFTVEPTRSPRPPGPVVLLMSADLDVLSQTQETRRYLHLLVPPEEGATPVPASAYNVAAQLLAVEAGVDHNPPSARVYLAGDRWVTLRAARIGDTGPPAGRDIAVTIEETAPAGRATLFARTTGLSTRETELLLHLLAGADTRELAGRMFLSEHTVQDHLKSIFAKTSVRSRRALLSRALGT